MARVLLVLSFAACFANLSDAAGAQTSGKMVRSMKAAGTTTPDELKEKLQKVMKSEQVSQMLQDPQLKDGLKDLLHNPEAVGKLTNDPELASSLQTMLDKDPHFVDGLIPGEDHPQQHALVDVEGATVEQIHTEFARLQEVDKTYAQELHDSMKVRKNLKRELEALTLSVSQDNDDINHHINHANSLMSVSAAGKAAPEGLVDSEDLEDVPEDNVPVSRFDIGNELEEHATKIRDLVKQLHAKDGMQMAAMRNNAKTRRSLKLQLQKRIKEQQEELDHAMKDEDSAFGPLSSTDE